MVETNVSNETTEMDDKPAVTTPITTPVTAAPSASAASTPASLSTSAPSRAKYLHFVAEAILLLAVVFLGTQLASVQTDKKNLQTQLASVQSNPQALVQKQSDDVISKVGLLMKLPAGETPTVAAVSDAAAASQQSPFFKNAANGDKVLLYVKAGEAILYRPSTNKIILVAPLTFNNAQAGTTKQ